MSKIEWTDETWNPVQGCEKVSPGCANCYAEQQAARIVRCAKGKLTKYNKLVTINARGEARWTGEVAFDVKVLAEPLKRRKPTTYFVNSMSDLFHDGFTNEQIAAVFGVMAARPQHTFILLTKRAERMRQWFEWQHEEPQWAALRCQEAAIQHGAWISLLDPSGYAKLGWPLPNVILGVSAENQATADERIPHLLATPAAVRMVSAEPLLGPIDISEYQDPCSVPCGEDPWPGIDWVIAGCESGRGARPCDVGWLRSLRDQCAEAQVPFFLKQAIGTVHDSDDTLGLGAIEMGPDSKRKPGGLISLPYLDGVQHDAMPKGWS